MADNGYLCTSIAFVKGDILIQGQLVLRSAKIITVGNSANASMPFLLEAVIGASGGGRDRGHKAKQKL